MCDKFKEYMENTNEYDISTAGQEDLAIFIGILVAFAVFGVIFVVSLIIG
jgi:hypothetical protein